MKKSALLLIPCSLLIAACGHTSSNSESELSQSQFNSSNVSIDYSQPNSQSLLVDPDKESNSSSSSALSSSSSSKPVSSSKIESSTNTPVTHSMTVSTAVVGGYAQTTNKILITKAGVYTLSGTLNGQVVVEAGDLDEVTIELNGVTIECDYNSPIQVLTADEVKIKANKGTTNIIKDNRPLKTEENDLDETLGNGAIYSKCDTKISGKGTLKVYSTYNNGVHSTKDLTLKMTAYEGSMLYINAVNNAIKGNDSVAITSGNIMAISTGGDGIKTDDSDISSKGNQRGNITITGGQIDIYSHSDGIDASYNANIETGIDEDTREVTIPHINIFTSKYSEYTESGTNLTPQSSKMYIRTTTRNNSAYRYSVLFKNMEGETKWADATFDKSVNSGRSTYYIYKLDKPSDAASFKIFKFNASSQNSEDSYVLASREYSSVNTNYDMVTFSEGSSNITNGNWSNYAQSQGGMGGPGGFGQEGNNDKADYSAKGIKSNNNINIKGGYINIKAYDDGLHAKYGETLQNATTSTGDLTISGGNLSIYSSDDGLHADRNCIIEGGNIDITNAYEGIEGNIITIKGGTTKIFSTDDGINAANKANMTPNIDIQGGFLDVTVYGNDVDGIDSNGNFKQSGGIVVTRGYGTNRMSTGLDCDGTCAISGGTMAVFGQPEKTPTLTGTVKSQTITGTYGEGTWKFVNGSTSFETTNKYSHSGIYIFSELGQGWTVSK